MIGRITESIVKGNTIRNSYNRAITIHGCHYGHIESNIAYNILGHTYFLEDGIETKNKFLYNLAVGTIATFGMLDTD